MAVDLAADLLRRIRRDTEVARLRARNGIRLAGGRQPARSGTTPKCVIWKRGKAELWRYETPNDRRQRPSVLLVHSLVSRSYVLDLQPGSSLVEELINAGTQPYLLDWGIADELEAGNTLETYVDDLIPPAVDAAVSNSGRPVNLVGYCLGGILAAVYLARHLDAPVASLSTLAAPIDFTELGLVVSMLRDERLSVDDLIDETGNIPPRVFRQAFRVMQPTAEIGQYINLLQNLWNDAFVDGHQAMSRWVADHIPFPGALARQATATLIRDNALCTGRLELGGRPVDLSQIRCPVLCVLAERDHIVPAAAAEPLADLVAPGRATTLRIPAGHVALVMGRHAKAVMVPALIEHVNHADYRGKEGHGDVDQTS
jgi:polyhydroxyalkanoate synthase